MIKIVFITDTHGKATNPSARLDDFPKTLIEKLEFVCKYAREINASAIIHGGDWVESPDISEHYISQMASAIIKNCSCPIYSIIGNHDIYGYNPITFDRTPLAIVNTCGVFKRLKRDTGVIIEGVDEAVNLTGQDAIYDLDKGTDYYYTDSFKVENHNNKPTTNIHVVHGLLSNHEWPVPHTLISDISSKCNADIILTGHDHTGYGLIRENNKIFCNPGSLSRTTASIGDVRRDVRLAVVTIDKENFDVEIVNLPSSIARPSNEVINRIKLEEIKKSKEQIDNFIVNLNNKKVNLGSNIYDAASSLAKQLNVVDTIFIKAKKELEKAEEVLKNE